MNTKLEKKIESRTLLDYHKIYLKLIDRETKHHKDLDDLVKEITNQITANDDGTYDVYTDKDTFYVNQLLRYRLTYDSKNKTTVSINDFVSPLDRKSKIVKIANKKPLLLGRRYQQLTKSRTRHKTLCHIKIEDILQHHVNTKLSIGENELINQSEIIVIDVDDCKYICKIEKELHHHKKNKVRLELIKIQSEDYDFSLYKAK